MPQPNPPHNPLVGVDGTVDLWDCPCRECTYLDWSAGVGLDGHPSLAEHRRLQFPEHYGTPHTDLTAQAS